MIEKCTFCVHRVEKGLLPTCGLVSISVAILLYALVTHNFQIAYVASYTSLDLSLAYLLSALWAGNDGSLLFWAWLLSLCAVVVVLNVQNTDDDVHVLGVPAFGVDTGSLAPRGGKAPASAFRLPGGILSWLLLLVGAVMLIWLTYFRVMYQVFRIPSVKEIGDTNTRLIPLLGMVIVVALGILLVLMLITSPYTHLHLLR